MASTPQLPLSTDPDAMEAVAGLIERARRAQRAIEGFSQERIDELTLAIGWAIMEPGRNRVLAEMAVRDTGLGNVDDKIAKNYRKTLGLLRDLKGRRTVGVIA
ncbi:MAG TPA: sulfoacetaldehyde dehydrogenase, partial [Burkholderiaceae bacterium]|nr:sulfoacetaldehyde dehydrogenase [Burkholderiaceae bacterium]